MIKLVFWGTPQFAVPSLMRLVNDSAFEVLGVVTQPDRRRGRGKQLVPSAVKATALEYGLPIWQPQSVKKDATTLAELRSQQADAFVVVAYGQLLSPEILSMPRLGCINSHGSLLPAYRGAAPIQWAIHDGQRKTGLTTMLMDAGMDTGDMLLQTTIDIDPYENAHELAARLAQQSGDLLIETLSQLEQHKITPIPQDATQATHARLIKKKDYRLDWANSALTLHNQIRGFFPSCIAGFRGHPIKVITSIPLDEEGQASSKAIHTIPRPEPAENQKPGSIVSIVKNKGPIVQTGKGYLFLESLQLAGKKRQSGWDFANGLHVSVGEALENG